MHGTLLFGIASPLYYLGIGQTMPSLFGVELTPIPAYQQVMHSCSGAIVLRGAHEREVAGSMLPLARLWRCALGQITSLICWLSWSWSKWVPGRTVMTYAHPCCLSTWHHTSRSACDTQLEQLQCHGPFARTDCWLLPKWWHKYCILSTSKGMHCFLQLPTVHLYARHTRDVHPLPTVLKHIPSQSSKW